MNVYINGEARQVPDTCSAADLVEELGLSGKRVAMEVNRDIIPRSAYAHHMLQPEDSIEIVHAIGGG